MSERLFGTNGVRGVVNRDMSPDLALQMGKAIGTVMKGTIAIAADTRYSGDMIRSAVSSGLMAVGSDVLDLGIIPTPALQYYVKTHDSISGGVMITASHNPPQFNGIKCIAADGTESSREQEMSIETAYANEISCVGWDRVGGVEEVLCAGEEYVDAIISKVDVESIRNAKFTVCLDCANGASYQTSPMLLRRLGVRAVTINADPQGEFPGHMSEPTEENLKDLMMMTKNIKADLGIAHDGDADRCIFVSGNGKFVSGDKSLAIMSDYVLKEKQGGTVVTPVSSSSMVEEVVVSAGGKIQYTAVGSPIVARAMIEGDAVFGGEENGGLIFPEQQYCRDGAMTIAKMLECIAKNGSLADMVSALPIYYTEKRKIECPDAVKKYVLEYLKRVSKDAIIDETDGLKVLFTNGWILARPSGTEPVFRIYAESKDEETAKKMADEYEMYAWEILDPEGNRKKSVKKSSKKTKSSS